MHDKETETWRNESVLQNKATATKIWGLSTMFHCLLQDDT